MNKDELDYLRVVAVHEAAHAVIWRQNGFKIESIKLQGSDTNPYGRVRLSNIEHFHKCPDGYLYGLLAGEQSGWPAMDFLDINIAEKIIFRGSGADIDSFNFVTKGENASIAVYRKKARLQVVQHWKEIVKLAERLLVRRGHSME